MSNVVPFKRKQTRAMVVCGTLILDLKNNGRLKLRGFQYAGVNESEARKMILRVAISALQDHLEQE